ncbi:HpcH/HpaI aldolase/citrate lyase family protein [Sphingomonas sp. S1-29]|uniref:HpcH/HpaI aldolase/citrate lyase family protein n=1 Tax=Sphingomonas sp. S1-29 TaxID=2991074 RepID=UPI00223F4E50|nr:HpcH/HpaI aldolase/citrate lyase family protein [Sphingomonas sp. S1-29]UZK68826.1 HpcH/HpaI aldolase/citrate lyase family protein [Sphingomonas sp. S1-29]
MSAADRAHQIKGLDTPATALGATLYLPATRGDLAVVLLGGWPNLRSAVVWLEDGVRTDARLYGRACL